MPYHLLTVDHVHKTGSSLGLQIAPTVPLARLEADYRSGSLPHAGDDLELRLPDGRVRYEKIGGFGIDGTRRGRYIHVAGDPKKLEMTLYIAGELEPGDVPSGTQIWLPGKEPGQGRPPAGPCSYCQMKELRAQGLIPPPLPARLTCEPGVTAQARISGHLGWRGPGSVEVGQDGVEFPLGRGFVTLQRQFVVRADLDFVYPVEPRRWSLTNLVAGAVESLSKTGVRFMTQPVGMFADRDDFLFYSYRHQEWELIDLLQELGYPVDKKPKTLRLFWGDET